MYAYDRVSAPIAIASLSQQAKACKFLSTWKARQGLSHFEFVASLAGSGSFPMLLTFPALPLPLQCGWTAVVCSPAHGSQKEQGPQQRGIAPGSFSMHPQAETKAALARRWPPFASATSPATAAGHPRATSSCIFSRTPICYGDPNGLVLSNAAPTRDAFYASYHSRHCPSAACGTSMQPTCDQSRQGIFLHFYCITALECYLTRAWTWICSLCRYHACLALTLTPTTAAAPTACATTSAGVCSVSCVVRVQPLWCVC